MEDKSPEFSRPDKLFLATKPALELKEWVTTDAQGLDTRIELSELVKTEDLDGNLFKIQQLGPQRIDAELSHSESKSACCVFDAMQYPSLWINLGNSSRFRDVPTRALLNFPALRLTQAMQAASPCIR